MNEFVIHSIPGSPFGRAVLVALEEKGAPYRLAPVAPGTVRTPEHLACHPFGRVPYLEHGGFTLYETAAITRYVDRVLPEPKLTPANPQAAARMDQLMNINDWYLFQGVSNVIAFQRVVRPRLMGLNPDKPSPRRCRRPMSCSTSCRGNWATGSISSANRSRWPTCSWRRNWIFSLQRRSGSR
jgi:glutathione S-transferase